MRILTLLLIFVLQEVSYSALQEIDEEFVCLMLSMNVVRLRSKEIGIYRKSHSFLPVDELTDKLADDSYRLCISQMTQELALRIGVRKIKDYEGYEYLIHAPLNYEKIEDLVLDPDYIKARSDLGPKFKEYERKRNLDF